MPSNPGSLRLRQALDKLLQGGVIACPTESVWGLSCDPGDAAAVQRLLMLKNRPVKKGLILVAAELEQLNWLLDDLPQSQQRKLALSWPGSTTWLIPHRDRVPTWIHGEHESVAVRVTEHPLLAALCRAWGGVLVSTSANPGGSQAAKEAFQVRRYFGAELDFLLPGATGGALRPSVIRDLVSDAVLRS